MAILRRSVCLLGCLLFALPAAAQDCTSGSFDSTFELIQQAIFDNQGCANAVCHGQGAAGGLDLREGASYANLIDVEATTVAGMTRVRPGRKDASLLWQNVAAKTFPDEVAAPLRAMPLDPLPALTPDAVEALRLWIEAGAPETGVVEGTAELLDACLPPAGPIVVRPLPPPPAGEGVQLRMPTWTMAANSEREVCLASAYDLRDEVPAPFRNADGDQLRFRRNEVRQSAGSHHLIVNLYEGETPIDDPSWGTFRCFGGDQDGTTCSPRDPRFCGDGVCGTRPQTSVACQGFGPGDAGVGLNSAGISGTQETSSVFEFLPGVYREMPVQGLLMWNHHVFNLTDEPVPMDARLNFEFASPDEQLHPVRIIFDTSEIFKMSVPAFETQEICHIFQMPKDAHLFELSSHAHRHMKRWRTHRGRWRCKDGPNKNEPCSPMGYDFSSPDVCGGAVCQAKQRPRTADCNTDNTVTVDEVLQAVSIALGTADVSSCHEADVDGSWSVSVDELIASVDAALKGIPSRKALDPHASLLYVSTVYDDPVVLRYADPIVFSGKGADRWLTFCALYDNGFVDPTEVKQQSTSPQPPIPLPFLGGPCAEPTGCTSGLVGAPCSGRSARDRNASCDTSPGAGDGVCDGCELNGGVTTEDEMFILMGQYFVP